MNLPSDSEALAALQARCDAHNLDHGTNLDLDGYMQVLIDSEALAAKMKAIDDKVAALATAAKQMPDAHRLALTEVFELITVKFATTPSDQLASLKATILSALQ